MHKLILILCLAIFAASALKAMQDISEHELVILDMPEAEPQGLMPADIIAILEKNKFEKVTTQGVLKITGIISIITTMIPGVPGILMASIGCCSLYDSQAYMHDEKKFLIFVNGISLLGVPVLAYIMAASSPAVAWAYNYFSDSYNSKIELECSSFRCSGNSPVLGEDIISFSSYIFEDHGLLKKLNLTQACFLYKVNKNKFKYIIDNLLFDDKITMLADRFFHMASLDTEKLSEFISDKKVKLSFINNFELYDAIIHERSEDIRYDKNLYKQFFEIVSFPSEKAFEAVLNGQATKQAMLISTEFVDLDLSSFDENMILREKLIKLSGYFAAGENFSGKDGYENISEHQKKLLLELINNKIPEIDEKNILDMLLIDDFFILKDRTLHNACEKYIIKNGIPKIILKDWIEENELLDRDKFTQKWLFAKRFGLENIQNNMAREISEKIRKLGSEERKLFEQIFALEAFERNMLLQSIDGPMLLETLKTYKHLEWLGDMALALDIKPLKPILSEFFSSNKLLAQRTWPKGVPKEYVPDAL